MCKLFSQSVQELQSSDTPKLPFSIDLLRRRYNGVRTNMRHCESSCLNYLSLLNTRNKVLSCTLEWNARTAVIFLWCSLIATHFVLAYYTSSSNWELCYACLSASS